MCVQYNRTGVARDIGGTIFCSPPSVPNRIRGDKTLPSTSYTLLDVVRLKKKKKFKTGKWLSREIMPGVEEKGIAKRAAVSREQSMSQQSNFCLLCMYVLQSTVMP